MTLLWKLLRKNISKSQITGFFIANLLGVIVLLLGVQFFSDTHSIFNQSDSFMKNEYIIISKEVSLLGSFVKGNNSFSEDEVSEIENKPFVKSVGKFSSSDFRVYASIGFGGQGISSDIFFESVPDKFVDTDLAEWDFKEGDTNIPIIIPRNYLNLYNFGFSQSRNLPKLTEDAISLVNFNVDILGTSKSERFKAHILGFSNRLNTILVPESFLSWANSNFGSQEVKDAPRLILEVTNTSDKALLSFFKEKGYDIEGNALNSGEMAYFARLITIIVLCIGLVVTILSIYILILSIFLLIEKNASKIETLIFMGYSPWRIILPYSAVVAVLNLIIMILGVFSALNLRGLYLNTLTDVYSFNDSTPAMAIIYLALALYVLITVVNMFVIRRKVLSLVR